MDPQRCNSSFLDDLPWISEDASYLFPTCFEKSLLLWIPCIFLWISLPYEIYNLKRSKFRDISLNLYNGTKLIAIFILIALSWMNFIYNTSAKKFIVLLDLYSLIARFCTFTLFFTLTWANMKRGVRSSGILFIFSLLLVICETPHFTYQVKDSLSTKNSVTEKFICTIVYYLSMVLILILNFFADSKPQYSLCPVIGVPNECPARQASFFSRLYFCWFDSIVWKAYHKPLENEDIWDLDYENTCAVVTWKFEKRWNKAQETKTKIIHVEKSDESYHIEVETPTTKKYQKLVIIPLFKAYFFNYVCVMFAILVESLLIFISPQLLNLIISFVNGDEPSWKGYLYSSLLLVSSFGQSLVSCQYFYTLHIMLMQVRSTLITMIYKKTLKISSKARRSFTTGEIMNLMASDVRKFTNVIWNFNILWSAPLQILGAFYFLWELLGLSAFSGIILILCFVPLNSYLALELKRQQRLRLNCKDKRIRVINEMLSGIKVLKLNAWEMSFEKIIEEIRIKEIEVLKKQIFLNVTLILLWNIVPYLISLVTFATYVLSSEDHVLDAQKIFVSVSLFNILKAPMSSLPQVVSDMMQTVVSLTRINKFLNSEELSPDAVSHEPRIDPLSIQNGSFSWIGYEGPAVLRNINVKIKRGSLVAIVGPVGSGKSSLLSAFLGETYKLSGDVNTEGNIAYVPQVAWIRNSTLRDNITLGEPLNGSFYNNILESCALVPDLKILPGGDLTEIGEKGINLSGGQKQRVSLARALYSNADIYFLDDPLSALDIHVGNYIFRNVLSSSGMLKEKTRVMVTHSVRFLAEVDYIIVLKDGTISECGTYCELLSNNDTFAEFLRNYTSEDGSDSSEEEKRDRNLRKLKKYNMEKTLCSMSIDENACKAFVERRKSKSSINSSGKKLMEKEHIATGNINKNVYKHFILSAGLFFPIVTLILFLALQSSIIWSNFWLSLWSTDENVTENGVQNIEIRNHYLFTYALFGICQAVFLMGGNLTLFSGFLKASTNMHSTLLSRVLKWPMWLFDTTPLGRILNRFGDDIDVIDYTLAAKTSKLLLKIGLIGSTLFIISYTTPVFIIVCALLLMLFGIMQKIYLSTSQQAKRLDLISRSPIYSHFGETITGLESIRAYNLQKKFTSLSEEKVDFNQTRVFFKIIAGSWSSLRLEAIANSVVFFASLFAVMNKDNLNAGLVGLSVSYSLQITKTFSWLIRSITEIETLMVSVERIKEFHDKPQEAFSESFPLSLNKNWPSKGRIEFRDYKVRYRENLDLVLKGLTLTVLGGERIGVVGRTGAGKSSLVMGLFRILEPAGGSIHIDGVDISTIGLRDLRSRLTIIPQDPVLFSGTLRINLDPFGKYTDECLWSALEHAYLKQYFVSKRGGLNYCIDEGGGNLSVGQRQLICLARALLRRTKILVLDEATAALDMQTDEFIQQTIREKFHDCTVVTIAHRLKTVIDYDRIIILDNGLLIEYDTPRALIEKTDSVFYEMAEEAGLL